MNRWSSLSIICVLLSTGRIGLSADKGHDLAALERSFWLHASLASVAQRGYWGPSYPASPSPTESEIGSAAKLLMTGAYPGYDDAAKNMPLPAGRNRLAVEEILQTAQVGRLAGFSSDLLILQANSQHPAHHGAKAGFYETLKRGEVYRGYYSKPFREVVAIFKALKAGKMPKAISE